MKISPRSITLCANERSLIIRAIDERIKHHARSMTKVSYKTSLQHEDTIGRLIDLKDRFITNGGID